MTTFDNLTSAQKIRAALHRDARAVCTETCHLLGLEITKSAMEVVAELLYRKLTVYGLDFEAFAKHAKRATINSDDVKLLVRRNPSLKTHLNSIAPTTTTAPKKRQKSSIFNSRPAETPDKSSEEKSTSASKDTDSKKEEKENALPLENFVDNMVLDTTIDLTIE